MRGGPRTSKLHSVDKEYNGHRYRSKKEARFAAQLDLRKLAGEIKGWRHGTSIFLVSNGVQLLSPTGRRLYSRQDFVIVHNDDREELIQVKGWKGGDSYARCWLKRQILRSMGVEVSEV